MALLHHLHYVDSYLMIIFHWMLRCQYGSPPLHVTSQGLSSCPKQLLEHCRLIYLPHLTLPLTTLATHLCWGPICNLHSTELSTSTPSQPVITASTTSLNNCPTVVDWILVQTLLSIYHFSHCWQLLGSMDQVMAMHVWKLILKYSFHYQTLLCLWFTPKSISTLVIAPFCILFWSCNGTHAHNTWATTEFFPKGNWLHDYLATPDGSC